MCGIVGCAGSIAGPGENAFKDMLLFDYLRGEDSTGVAFVTRDGEVDVVKGAVDPITLMDTGRFTDRMRKKNVVLIGHNRAATTGKVVKRNAHPFEFDNLVGVHNGTLRNKYHIPGNTQFDTDSEALYNYINEFGVEAAINIVKGAYALVWYDKKEDTICLLRNDERPLFLAQSKDRKQLYWASEAWMMVVATSRRKIELLSDPVELPINSLFTYNIPDVGKEFEKANVKKVEQPIEVVEKKDTSCSRGFLIDWKDWYDRPQNGPNEFARIVNDMNNIKFKASMSAYPSGKGAYYLNLEVVEGTKQAGASYRLYGTEKELDQYFGTTIIGSVSYALWQGQVLKYYKISPHSVTICKEAVSVKTDHLGKAISEEKWLKNTLGICSWCGQPVAYEDEWTMTDEDICVCEDCSSAPALLKLCREVADSCA